MTALFQDEKGRSDSLRAGALGFKGGVLLPSQPWLPLLFSLTIGFAKTVLHESPFFGDDKKTVAKKEMLLLEGGLLYHYDQYFIRGIYQISTVKYFHRHLIFGFGVVY